MNQQELLMAPKVSESHLIGVGYKPLTGGALIYPDMFLKHGECKGGRTRLYRIWGSMKQRVNNPNNTHYEYYGGKGIKIIEDWYNFTRFKNWAINNGYSNNMTIDRIDNNGNYEPNNCRWVTKKINNQNKTYRSDYGIYHKKNGFYVQITIDGIYYCGGYSLDINETRKFKNQLITEVKEKHSPFVIKRKIRTRNKITGRIVWV